MTPSERTHLIDGIADAGPRFDGYIDGWFEPFTATEMFRTAPSSDAFIFAVKRSPTRFEFSLKTPPSSSAPPAVIWSAWVENVNEVSSKEGFRQKESAGHNAIYGAHQS